MSGLTLLIIAFYYSFYKDCGATPPLTYLTSLGHIDRRANAPIMFTRTLTKMSGLRPSHIPRHLRL